LMEETTFIKAQKKKSARGRVKGKDFSPHFVLERRPMTAVRIRRWPWTAATQKT
jgi:hypothetical protein